MEGEIKKIQFDRLSDEQMEEISDCKVYRQYSNTFLEGTMYDRHMGVCDRGKLCETCCTDWENCVGGYGLIKLPAPYYFDNIRTIVKTLNGICKTCSRIACDCEEKTFYKILAKKSKDKIKCEYEFTEDNQKLSLHQIYNLLKSANSVPLMNYNVFVTPIYTRPYLIKSGQYLHNDISTIYNFIIKEINKDNINYRELFDKIEMLLTQKKNKLLPNSSKIPQSLQEKIQGKEGLINSNINGKRVDHSARANITGYPDGILGDVGVPVNMAKKMTILENINRIMNTNDISDWINQNNPLRVKKSCGKTFRFTTQTTPRIITFLEKGDSIERPIKNGDVVLFNRQPSLRPESIIAKRVKIIDSKDCNTFRLTLPCTPPLNADFDGDECNVHVLQDIRARVECYELMNPAEQIISTQKGTPLFVPVQDSLIGTYIITDKNCLISKTEFFDVAFSLKISYKNLLDKISKWNFLNGGKKIRDNFSSVPGQLLFSLILDDYFYFRLEDFAIENGIILSSSCSLTKRILAGGLKSLIHKYYFSIGKWETCSLIDNIQVLTNYYLARRGFSISLTDCIIPISSYKNDRNTDVNTVLGRIEVELTQPGFIDRERNNLYKIVQSGAKGSMTNIVQITQLVGQQSIDGTKVRSEMSSQRTLIYYKPNSAQAYEESGFVNSSFYEGLSKSSNLFHAKAGRRGVTDSVTKVSESGYTSKKICKFVENQIIEHDLSVRNNETKRVVQFLFGTDGMNPQQLPAENGKKCYLTTEDCVALDLHKCCCLEESTLILTFALNRISLGLRKPNPILNELTEKILQQSKKILANFTYSTSSGGFINKQEAELITILHGLLFKRIFQPGTAIGAICGTNFGEITSQLLLKSFHHAGIKNKDISGGIKRLNQLLNRTCSPSDTEIICIARIDDQIYTVLRNSREIVEDEFSKNILSLLMENRCHQLLNRVKMLQFSSFVKTAIFKRCKCYSRSCTLFSIICGLSTEYYTILYEMNDSTIDDSFISLGQIKEALSSKLNLAFVSFKNNLLLSLPFEKKDLWYDIKKISDVNKLVLSTNINQGVIKNCYVEYEDSINDFEIIFQGIKMSKLLDLPFIDATTIYSTDPFENVNTFGIEAGRYSLFDEIVKVLSFDGADIDFRYIDLICDAMCCDGKIVSIVNSPGIITNALFEKEIKKLTSHSINKNVDLCNSVEACVFLGKLCKIGTGFVDILES